VAEKYSAALVCIERRILNPRRALQYCRLGSCEQGLSQGCLIGGALIVMRGRDFSVDSI
jgi:hypothetical protein